MTMTQQNGRVLDEQSKAVEAGLAMHLRVKAELEAARQEIDELKSLCAKNEIQIEALHGVHNMLESRMLSAVVARDEAIGARARYESLFAMILATMREFRIPAVPLIRDKEADNNDDATTTATGAG